MTYYLQIRGFISYENFFTQQLVTKWCNYTHYSIFIYDIIIWEEKLFGITWTHLGVILYLKKPQKTEKNKHMKHSPSNHSHEEAKRLLFSSKPDSIHVHACVGVYIELFNMLIFRGEKLFFLYTNSRVNPSLLT